MINVFGGIRYTSKDAGEKRQIIKRKKRGKVMKTETILN